MLRLVCDTAAVPQQCPTGIDSPPGRWRSQVSAFRVPRWVSGSDALPEASSSADALLRQNKVVGVSRRRRSLFGPVPINLEDDFVGGVAHRKRNVLNVRTSQKIHDAIVKDSFLIQLGSGQQWVVRVGHVILRKMFLDVVREISRLHAPDFVLGRDKGFVHRAEQKAGQNSNNADDQQQFRQGEPGSRAMISFHTGLDNSSARESRGRCAGRQWPSQNPATTLVSGRQRKLRRSEIFVARIRIDPKPHQGRHIPLRRPADVAPTELV